MQPLPPPASPTFSFADVFGSPYALSESSVHCMLQLRLDHDQWIDIATPDWRLHQETVFCSTYINAAASRMLLIPTRLAREHNPRYAEVAGGLWNVIHPTQERAQRETMQEDGRTFYGWSRTYWEQAAELVAASDAEIAEALQHIYARSYYFFLPDADQAYSAIFQKTMTGEVVCWIHAAVFCGVAEYARYAYAVQRDSAAFLKRYAAVLPETARVVTELVRALSNRCALSKPMFDKSAERQAYQQAWTEQLKDTWSYLDQGTYNLVYQHQKEPRVLKVPLRLQARCVFDADAAERLCRLWNTMYPELPRAEVIQMTFAGEKYSLGVFPWIAGKIVTDRSCIQRAILHIYNKTQRVIVDAFAKSNFVQIPSGAVVCIDLAHALQLGGSRQDAISTHTMPRQRASFDSVATWNNTLQTSYHQAFIREIGGGRGDLIQVICALLVFQAQGLQNADFFLQPQRHALDFTKVTLFALQYCTDPVHCPQELASEAWTLADHCWPYFKALQDRPSWRSDFHTLLQQARAHDLLPFSPRGSALFFLPNHEASAALMLPPPRRAYFL